MVCVQSSHLFKHYPGRYAAYEDYPRTVPPRAQASLPPTRWGRFVKVGINPC